MTTAPSSTEPMQDRPLHGLLVLDFSQFLSGPLATLRLADLGARVIKIERPGQGDLGRTLYLSDTDINGENTLFHAINRNKESLAADLKNPACIEKLRRLIARADVMVQNFRPGVIERLKLDYQTVAQTNPRIVYGSVSGYGDAGAWRDRPGQDLLAQARSGIMWLSGNEGDPPTPFSLAIADMLTGHNLCQGILGLSGAARHHGTRRACGGQPAGIVAGLSVRSSHHVHERWQEARRDALRFAMRTVISPRPTECMTRKMDIWPSR